jgi:CxxC motif-containing protein
MRELTCIVCPIGCSLTVDEGQAGPEGLPELTVSGNRCPRGPEYAREEIRAPKRVVTATCGIDTTGEADSGKGEDACRCVYSPRRIPVRTAVPCPKEKISALLADIYTVKVKLPVAAGDVIIADWQGSGINIVAARTIRRSFA